MAQPYIGEIRMFAGTFPPAGWAFCDGQLQPISENEALFTLIGTTYGGDGQETFALPDLRGRIPVHNGTGTDGISYVMGELGGAQEVTLNTNQIPAHGHALRASNNATTPAYSASNGVLGKTASANIYALAPSTGPMMANHVGSTGGSQPHSNMAPYLSVHFIISLYGIFPYAS
jgi:microcystin-dependent protein